MANVRKYRKKPVVVEAEELTERTLVRTLEGEMTGEAGDYLITGIKGEKYPCKPDIFHQTYEPVDDEAERPRGEDVDAARDSVLEVEEICRKILREHPGETGWIMDADMLIDKFERVVDTHMKVLDRVKGPKSGKTAEKLGESLNWTMDMLRIERHNLIQCMFRFQRVVDAVMDALREKE